jgi:hypothetical protein
MHAKNTPSVVSEIHEISNSGGDPLGAPRLSEKTCESKTARPAARQYESFCEGRVI